MMLGGLNFSCMINQNLQYVNVVLACGIYTTGHFFILEMHEV